MRTPAMKLAFSVMAVLWSAAAIQAANKGPDSGSYTATDATVFSFIELAGGGGSASVLAGTDDGVALLTLPFPFQFYGTSYTLACVSANGLLNFVTSAAACNAAVDFANTDLTSTAPPGDQPGLLPYWTDLSFQPAGAGAVYYQVQGSAGSRKFIVEWKNAFPQGSVNPATFELVLYEGANKILFQYQTVDLGAGNPATNGALATVGIRAAGGNANNKQIAWSFNAPVTTNSSAILFEPPSGAQTSVNTITTTPPGLNVTIDGVSYATPKVVSWSIGSNHTLQVASPLVVGGARYTLINWLKGGASEGTSVQLPVTAAAGGATYTATFSTEYQLTTATNPAGAGAITGAGWYASGASVEVRATAPANYSFAFFSGDLSGATNPQNVTMNGPKNVVANFQSTANPVLTAAVTGKADGASGLRLWTLRLTNTGAGAATTAQITSVTLTQVLGTPCSPAASAVTAMPVSLGNIAAGGNAAGQVTINFAGCTDPAARFSVLVRFAASGGYTGSTTINNQTR